MIDTTKLRELAKMTPEQNTDYERLKQSAASVWFAGNMYIGPSMAQLMQFLAEYKRLSPEYEQPATAPAGYKVVPDALRKLCKSATPGPWRSLDDIQWNECVAEIGDLHVVPNENTELSDGKNDAAYIAAANPATVLALLDELDRTKGTVAIAGAALSAAERELDRLRTIEAAARNLAKVKGRHNSEIAMNQLLEALK